MTILVVIGEDGTFCSITLPVIFLLLHTCYGIGTLKGLILGVIHSHQTKGEEISEPFYISIKKSKIW